MKKIFFPAIALAIFTFSSCKSDKKVEIKDGKIGVSDAIDAVQALGKGVEDAQNRWEERRKKGDTVALQYKELESFLPDFNGYTKEGGPKGNQSNIPGMGGFSQTEQTYVNGDKRIKVSITDYNASQMAFTAATALYSLNISSEDDDKRQGSVDLGMKDVAAYETIYKQRQEAELAVIAGDRFYIMFSSDGSNDIDQLKSVAKDVVSKLSSKF
jgi:hypothetical protein